METLSNEIMLGMLQKVQPLQVEIIKTGRHCHVDGGMFHSYIVNPGGHVNFEVDIFEDNELVRDFNFSAMDSQKMLDAEFAKLQAYVEHIKEE